MIPNLENENSASMEEQEKYEKIAEKNSANGAHVAI